MPTGPARVAFFALGLAAIAIFAAPATSQVAPISLQGRVQGVPDGEVQMRLLIWDTPTGGQVVASDTTSALVSGGVFTLLGALPPEAFGRQPRWWSVEIAGTPLEGRHRVAAAPLALTASRLEAFHLRTDRAVALPPQGSILESNWGAFLISENNDDRIIRLGVSDDGYTRSELRLENANSGTGRINLLTGSGSEAPRSRLFITESGQVGIGTQAPSSTLDVAGSTTTTRLTVRGTTAAYDAVIQGGLETHVLRITGGSDLAEPFPAAPSAVAPKPGMVLSIDPANPGALRVCTEAYDTKVAGVYSGGNGLNTGMLMGQEGDANASHGEDRLPLAMTGRVWVYADDSGGEIKPGDRLTTSGANAGYAARVDDEARAPGTVIGKAMTGIDEATGMVLVLVNLQ